MATTVKASRRRKKKTATPKRKKAGRRRTKKTVAVTARRRRKRRVSEVKVVKAKRRRARRTVRAATPVIVQAPRRKRAKRRKTRRVKAWKGNSAGHAAAARKGIRRKKARGGAKRRRSSKRRTAREVTYAAAPRRRRRVKASTPVMQASRRRRGRRRARGMFEPRGSRMGVGEFVMVGASAGLGFLLADGLDRLLATYNPAGTEPPKDKFTSASAGTLANVLNLGSAPTWMRLGASGATVALPAVGSFYIKNPTARAAVSGLALGAGVSTFKLLWNNVIMPLLLPKEITPQTLQTSYIARLYPAEVAAHVNRKSAGGATPVSSTGSGALSDSPGVAAPDVGPFALAAESPYPDAAQALRREAGIADPAYPSMQNTWGTGGDSPYPSAAQALRREAGMSAPAQAGTGYQPGPPTGSGPGPKADPHTDPSCGCIGDEGNPFLGFIGDPAPASDSLTLD